jgi:hypothetical protein
MSLRCERKVTKNVGDGQCLTLAAVHDFISTIRLIFIISTIRWVFLIFSILVLITSERPLILSVKQQPKKLIESPNVLPPSGRDLNPVEMLDLLMDLNKHLEYLLVLYQR